MLFDGDYHSYALGRVGVLVLAIYALHSLVRKVWEAREVPISAACVTVVDLLIPLARLLNSASPGYLALAGSFLLLALGTVVTLIKHRWQRLEAQ